MLRFPLLLTSIVLAICVSLVGDCHSQQGLWDAQLECPGGPIRFDLKIDKHNDDWSAWLINGTEQIQVPGVKKSDVGTLILSIDHYDSELTLTQVPKTDRSEPFLVGSWKKRRKVNKWVEMDFSASQADSTKPNPKLDQSNFDGRWEVKFSSSDEPAVGVFETDPKTGKLGGTFMTTTGDYRFLSGTVNEDKMEISCFDGAHAFLFKASIDKEENLKGDFWSSKHWHETWTATRNDNAKLPDSFELTKATETNINALSFPDLDGKQTRLNDARFAAPVRIVHIFGSWCPNCHDAAVYLSELETKYGKDISVVGVAFELTGDFKRDAEQVRKYLKRNMLDHTVLIGGTSDKSKASKAVGIIDEVRSYPTTIFADRFGKIVAVHQGFSGPATGDTYSELKIKFESTINGIIKAARLQAN